jgi:iron(III) transport system ATP-binding protein
MSDVRIRGLTKRWHGKPPVTAIDNLDLDVQAGEFLVLLGPSGCGKTTTLRCIAGLETANEGEIHFGERSVFDAARSVNVPPNKRQIGMVFQSYALWPHMTVRKNIGYPLKARRVDKATARTWVEETAALVDCSPLLERFPGQLSGGQQQRVAVARGLVARPELVLFDEPLSNLDARLRDQVRAEIHELHGRLGFTAVYVTHDQSEALALGHRLAIMRSGKIEQLATPEEIYEEPVSEYVAGFIGMSNRFTLEVTGEGAFHEGQALGVDGEALGLAPGSYVVRSRAEDVRVDRPEESAPPGWYSIPAVIVDSEFGGLVMHVVAEIGESRMQSRIAAGERGSWARTLSAGQDVRLSWDPVRAKFFDASGARVNPTGVRGPATVAGPPAVASPTT